MLNWKEQKKLATAVGISPTFVNDILNRRRPCPVKRALAMGKAYFELTGQYIPYWEFTFNDISMSSAFSDVDYKVIKRIEETMYGNTEPRQRSQTNPA